MSARTRCMQTPIPACITNTRKPAHSALQGHLNNFRVVQPTLQFSIDAPQARRAFVVGDWDGWLVSVRTWPSSGSSTRLVAESMRGLAARLLPTVCPSHALCTDCLCGVLPSRPQILPHGLAWGRERLLAMNYQGGSVRRSMCFVL